MMPTLESYARAIAQLAAANADADIRVRVSPREQMRLLTDVFTGPLPGNLGDYKPGVFLRDVLGASEWMVDISLPETTAAFDVVRHG